MRRYYVQLSNTDQRIRDFLQSLPTRTGTQKWENSPIWMLLCGMPKSGKTSITARADLECEDDLGCAGYIDRHGNEQSGFFIVPKNCSAFVRHKWTTINLEPISIGNQMKSGRWNSNTTFLAKSICFDVIRQVAYKIETILSGIPNNDTSDEQTAIENATSMKEIIKLVVDSKGRNWQFGQKIPKRWHWMIWIPEFERTVAQAVYGNATLNQLEDRIGKSFIKIQRAVNNGLNSLSGAFRQVVTSQNRLSKFRETYLSFLVGCECGAIYGTQCLLPAFSTNFQCPISSNKAIDTRHEKVDMCDSIDSVQSYLHKRVSDNYEPICKSAIANVSGVAQCGSGTYSLYVQEKLIDACSSCFTKGTQDLILLRQCIAAETKVSVITELLDRTQLQCKARTGKPWKNLFRKWDRIICEKISILLAMLPPQFTISQFQVSFRKLNIASHMVKRKNPDLILLDGLIGAGLLAYSNQKYEAPFGVFDDRKWQ